MSRRTTRQGKRFVSLAQTNKVLVSCEGSAECVIVETLHGAGLLVVPPANLVSDPSTGMPYTTLRSARDIERSFLAFDYGAPLLVARVLDRAKERFSLSKAYQDKAEAFSFVTKPEIEMLIIHAEHAYREWDRYQRQLRGSGQQAKPSVFCRDRLGMHAVKSRVFLEPYWGDAGKLLDALRAYRAHSAADEMCLLDLVRE